MASSCRKLGSIAAIGYGVVTAIAPSVGAALVKRMVGKNFENAGELEARPEYRRQIRALGVGTAAAGIAGLVLEARAEESSVEVSVGEEPDAE